MLLCRIKTFSDYIIIWMVGWFNGVQRNFQQYFSYIVEASFIGGVNRSTQRKPQTSRKSHKVVLSTPRHERKICLD
jgi:hypothetical protein